MASAAVDRRPPGAEHWRVWAGGDPSLRLEDRYETERELGRPGAYGYAVLARDRRSGAKVAIKVIDKNALTDEDLESLRSELRVMRELAHDHIVRWVETGESETHVNIVMEPCYGGELLDRLTELGTFSEKQTKVIMREMVAAVAHMHAKGFAHCDLKPDNILFATPDPESPVKLIDFGLAKICTPGNCFHDVTGTPYYIAPEVLQGSYTYHCDLWAVGVLLFIMLFGFAPFDADDLDSPLIHQQLQAGFFPETRPGRGPFFPLNQPCSQGARDLITALLRNDTVVRLTAAEALRHPYLQPPVAAAAAAHFLADLAPFLALALRPGTGAVATRLAHASADMATLTPYVAHARTCLPALLSRAGSPAAPAQAGALTVSALDVLLKQAKQPATVAHLAELLRLAAAKDAFLARQPAAVAAASVSGLTLADFASALCLQWLMAKAERLAGLFGAIAAEDPSAGPGMATEASVRAFAQSGLEMQESFGKVAPLAGAGAQAQQAVKAFLISGATALTAFLSGLPGPRSGYFPSFFAASAGAGAGVVDRARVAVSEAQFMFAFGVPSPSVYGTFDPHPLTDDVIAAATSASVPAPAEAAAVPAAAVGAKPKAPSASAVPEAVAVPEALEEMKAPAAKPAAGTAAATAVAGRQEAGKAGAVHGPAPATGTAAASAVPETIASSSRVPAAGAGKATKKDDDDYGDDDFNLESDLEMDDEPVPKPASKPVAPAAVAASPAKPAVSVASPTAAAGASDTSPGRALPTTPAPASAAARALEVEEAVHPEEEQRVALKTIHGSGPVGEAIEAEEEAAAARRRTAAEKAERAAAAEHAAAATKAAAADKAAAEKAAAAAKAAADKAAVAEKAAAERAAADKIAAANKAAQAAERDKLRERQREREREEAARVLARHEAEEARARAKAEAEAKARVQNEAEAQAKAAAAAEKKEQLEQRARARAEADAKRRASQDQIAREKAAREEEEKAKARADADAAAVAAEAIARAAAERVERAREDRARREREEREAAERAERESREARDRAVREARQRRLKLERDAARERERSERDRYERAVATQAAHVAAVVDALSAAEVKVRAGRRGREASGSASRSETRERLPSATPTGAAAAAARQRSSSRAPPLVLAEPRPRPVVMDASGRPESQSRSRPPSGHAIAPRRAAVVEDLLGPVAPQTDSQNVSPRDAGGDSGNGRGFSSYRASYARSKVRSNAPFAAPAASMARRPGVNPYLPPSRAPVRRANGVSSAPPAFSPPNPLPLALVGHDDNGPARSPHLMHLPVRPPFEVSVRPIAVFPPPLPSAAPAAVKPSPYLSQLQPLYGGSSAQLKNGRNGKGARGARGSSMTRAPAARHDVLDRRPPFEI